MDAVHYFFNGKLPDELAQKLEAGHFLDLREQPQIAEWFWLTKVVIDINQLFHVYRWNYLQLRMGIDATIGGTIRKTRDNGTGMEWPTIINGYTINFVSAGKDLIETVRALHRHLEKCEEKPLDPFEQAANNQFDTNYYYTLLSELRNYAQHGQLLVSTYRDGSDKKACFDLAQLARPTLIKQNARASKTIEHVINNILEAEGEHARTLYCITIDKMHECILELYGLYLDSFEPYVREKARGVIRELELRPESLYQTPDGQQVALCVDGNELHPMIGDPFQVANEMNELSYKVAVELTEHRKYMQQVWHSDSRKN